MYLRCIKELRVKKGLTQRALAEKMNLSVTAYRQIEKGVVQKVNRLIARADFYGVTLDYLFERCDSPDGCA